jgi:hypothetical protein
MNNYTTLAAKIHIVIQEQYKITIPLSVLENLSKDIIYEVTDMMINNAGCEDEIESLKLRRNELLIYG